MSDFSDGLDSRVGELPRTPDSDRIGDLGVIQCERLCGFSRMEISTPRWPKRLLNRCRGRDRRRQSSDGKDPNQDRRMVFDHLHLMPNHRQADAAGMAGGVVNALGGLLIIPWLSQKDIGNELLRVSIV